MDPEGTRLLTYCIEVYIQFIMSATTKRQKQLNMFSVVIINI